MKKIGGDQNHTLFRHDDGHEIKIAHAGIPAIQREQLIRLKMAKGGEAEPSDDTSALPTPGPTPEFQQGNMGPAMSGDEIKSLQSNQPLDEYQEKENPAYTAHESAESGLASGVPASSNNSQDYSIAPDRQPTSKPMYQDQQQQPIDDTGSSQLQRQLAANQAIQNGYLKKLNDSNAAFENELRSKKIDPERLYGKPLVGGKMGRAIALFAAGYNGAGSPAANFLNESINRDIDAQKNDQSKSMNLWKMHKEGLQDDMAANLQTRNNLLQMANIKIDEQMGKLPGSMADQRLTLLKSQIGNEIDQNNMATAARKAAQMGNGNLSAIDLSRAGLISPQIADKEQASIDRQNSAIKSAHELYDQMEKEQTAGNLLNPQSHKRMSALKADLVNTIMNVSPSKRLTKESVEEEIDPLLISTTDDKQTQLQRRQMVLNAIQKHAEPTPYMNHYAPHALPNYSISTQEQAIKSQQPQMGEDGKMYVQRGKYMVPVGQ